MDGHTLPLLVVQSSVSEKGVFFFFFSECNRNFRAALYITLKKVTFSFGLLDFPSVLP